MNKGGFNWFYLVILVALGLLFYPLLNSSSSTKSIDEDAFFCVDATRESERS